MSRHQSLKQLNLRKRNQLRSILSSGGTDALALIGRLKSSLGKSQIDSLESVLLSSALVKSAKGSLPFPRQPPFRDALRNVAFASLEEILKHTDQLIEAHANKLEAQIRSFAVLDKKIASKNCETCAEHVDGHLDQFGWSHALLRRLVLIRELFEDISHIEPLIASAGLSENNIVVTSLVHAYAVDQNYLPIKRSTLNAPDRGSINRYSRALSKIAFSPLANTSIDLASIAGEISKCSLVDTVIILNFNRHLFDAGKYIYLQKAIEQLESSFEFDQILALYDPSDSEGEYTFNKHSSAWLEYPAIRSYRLLVDSFYDGLDPQLDGISSLVISEIEAWAAQPTPHKLVTDSKLTAHPYTRLSELEHSGTVTRSALLNYWLFKTEGQIGIEKEDLLQLMSRTRDLARTIPISSTRTLVKIAQDRTVKLILLLLLAKRSKNERDGFQLRRLLESFAMTEHNNSLVTLVEAYGKEHPVIAEYIYEITTEDFLARFQLAQHLSDIPEMRAQLHEWMARHAQNEYYMERARAVRVDHQLNRVRNEIDDHRIYVDPSRFWSWINDEVMIDLNSALTTSNSGKKSSTYNCDEALLSSVVQQCYSSFCSNGIFGIASYIGRRIRHGTFHGHIYSSTINAIETNAKYSILKKDPAVSSRWDSWKVKFDGAVEEIIRERLHVLSKTKPNGLLQPEAYGPHKLNILEAAIQDICVIYADTKSTENLDKIIIDYCWRLAEADLYHMQSFLKSQHTAIKQPAALAELVSAIAIRDAKLAAEFKRELVQAVDKKLTAMYSWFKRPSNISPKASLSLLYEAVVAEVKDSYPNFKPDIDVTENGDLELIGGAYHVLYDSFFVVLSNAAKYGDASPPVRRRFGKIFDEGEKGTKKILIEIASKIPDEISPESVSLSIEQRKSANYDDANLYERKSGIPKLMQLQHARKEFSVDFLGVVDGEVVVRLIYELAY